jgi:hypothetical protein
MHDFYELGLARSLEQKMAKALADAGLTLVPTLGAGMSITRTNGTEHSYDPIRGVLTITGVVKIDVHGLTKAA